MPTRYVGFESPVNLLNETIKVIIAQNFRWKMQNIKNLTIENILANTKNINASYITNECILVFDDLNNWQIRLRLSQQ